MTNTFDNNTGLIKQSNGSNSGTWGDYLNTNCDISSLLIGGVVNETITVADVTPANVNGVADDGKNLIFVCSGALTGNRNLILPTFNRHFFVENDCTGSFTLTVKTSAGTGIAIPQGGVLPVYCDGTNIKSAINAVGIGAVTPAVSTSFTAQQNFAIATLTDGATINWNLATQQVAKVILAGNRTLANPTNIVAGGTYQVYVYQDSTGARTLSYGAAWDWGLAGVPILSTGAGVCDIITASSPDGVTLMAVITKGF